MYNVDVKHYHKIVGYIMNYVERYEGKKSTKKAYLASVYELKKAITAKELQMQEKLTKKESVVEADPEKSISQNTPVKIRLSQKLENANEVYKDMDWKSDDGFRELSMLLRWIKEPLELEMFNTHSDRTKRLYIRLCNEILTKICKFHMDKISEKDSVLVKSMAKRLKALNCSIKK